VQSIDCVCLTSHLILDVATTRYQSPSPSSKPQPLYIEGAGAKASLSAVDLGTTQLIALAYTNISEILYIPVLR